MAASSPSQFESVEAETHDMTASASALMLGAMMQMVVLFGPPAVGKMTVGQELARRTGFRLLHNHMTIDLVDQIFEFGSPSFCKVVHEIRRSFVTAAAEAGGPSLVFTYVWALDREEDRSEIDEYSRIVASRGGAVNFVELNAEIQVRLQRNRSENRLKHKKKSDFVATEAQILDAERRFRMSTDGRFPYPDRLLRLDNSDLSPEDAASSIIRRFDLPAAGP